MATKKNQPSYDFLTGGPTSPVPSRPALRETGSNVLPSTMGKMGEGNESLRAKINSLVYELDSLKQERDVRQVQHEAELQDAQRRAETDFQKAQTAESTARQAGERAELILREKREEGERFAAATAEQDRKLRVLEAQNATLGDEAGEVRAELASAQRESAQQFAEVQAQMKRVKEAYDELKHERDARVVELEEARAKVTKRDEAVATMENEALLLKAQAGDVATLAVMKKEFSEMVSHCKKLEATGREQGAELKHFRKNQKAIEVVEEEKRALEAKVKMMEDLRRELGETRLQRQILEDERKSWSTYLESQKGDGVDDVKFETPEDLARAFIRERFEKMSLVEQLGSVKPDIAERDENIRQLEDDKQNLVTELEKLRLSGGNDSGAADNKARMRLERQRTLAVKEAEYLRAQLKAVDAEEQEFAADKVDEQKTTRIDSLEALVEQYRGELQSTHDSLTKLEEEQAQAKSAPSSPRKRKRTESPDLDETDGLLRSSQSGLRAQNSLLQASLEELRTRNNVLEVEVEAGKTQIESLKASSRTRILELRGSPTEKWEAIKTQSISALREENAALLEQLKAQPSEDGKTSSTRSSSRRKMIPQATLDAAQAEVAELKRAIMERDKKMGRFRDIFKAKSYEFREAVASLLGWRMDFLQNGKVKCTSMYYPSGNADAGEVENSIIFDGDAGTMKISGGEESAFAAEIRGSTEFWVEGRKEIPCFLAALTLEFDDKRRRDA